MSNEGKPSPPAAELSNEALALEYQELMTWARSATGDTVSALSMLRVYSDRSRDVAVEYARRLNLN